MISCPPPMPSFLDLLTPLKPHHNPRSMGYKVGDPIPVCRKCSTNTRWVRNSGVIDSYCVECRREANRKYYNAIK